jgi:activator of HSP90 ATPase
MVLHNPNNWHWVNKDTSGWARDYLDKEVVGLEAEENGISAKIDKILSMDGDVDVNQRKGKVITLFDVKLQLEYSGWPLFLEVWAMFLTIAGKTKDNEDASGTVTIPEVAHDTTEDEYVVRSLVLLS